MELGLGPNSGSSLSSNPSSGWSWSWSPSSSLNSSSNHFRLARCAAAAARECPSLQERAFLAAALFCAVGRRLRPELASRRERGAVLSPFRRRKFGGFSASLRRKSSMFSHGKVYLNWVYAILEKRVRLWPCHWLLDIVPPSSFGERHAPTSPSGFCARAPSSVAAKRWRPALVLPTLPMPARPNLRLFRSKASLLWHVGILFAGRTWRPFPFLCMQWLRMRLTVCVGRALSATCTRSRFRTGLCWRSITTCTLRLPRSAFCMPDPNWTSPRF